MRPRTAWLNRTGLALLGMSCLLAVAMAVIPPLSPWSSRAIWMIGIGLLAYSLTLLVCVLPSAPPVDASHPSLRRLLDIRRSMASRLAELEAAPPSGRSPLIPVVAEAVRHMDSQLVPTFRSIVVRHQELDHHLFLFETGDLAPPDPDNLARLHRIFDRQQEAIDESVRQAANAYAILLALLQETDEAGAAKQARMWATDLNDIYDGLAEVLSGVDPYEQAMLQLRLDADKRQPVQGLIEEALDRIEPTARVAPAVGQTASPARREYPDGLTQRETEVLALLADGLPSKQIADQLVVTLATVSRHIANIYTKINARGRVDATRYALQHGISTQGADPSTAYPAELIKGPATGPTNGQAAQARNSAR